MRSLRFLLICLILCSCATSHVPETEFRGIWIATVVNIDWPKNPRDEASIKKDDFIKILDFYEILNFNAAIVQIRCAGDALYQTDLAPWSKYLSGEQGKAPENFENPLKWMIDETHKRGMEFHAWLNPYRATFDLDTLALSETHDYYQHPDWMVKYGKKYYYNPGLPEVQQKFVQVVKELTNDYEIDAIHFDDYFYPYKIEGEQFEDQLAYQNYRLPNQNLEDWRRSNVDSLVKNVHLVIKQTNPWVQFGISPFGVWKNQSSDPKGSNTNAGQTTYEDLYADPLLWVEKGWLDYLAPQAYWSMDYPPASHRNVVTWWANNIENTNLYIGNGAYKIRNNKDEAWERKKEIPTQLEFSRNLDNVSGNIFFSAKSMIGQHKDVTKKLQRKFYRYPSKAPTPRNAQKGVLTKPHVDEFSNTNGRVRLSISHQDSVPRFINCYIRKSYTNRQLIERSYMPSDQIKLTDSFQLPKKYAKKQLEISISDAYGNESETTPINPKSK